MAACILAEGKNHQEGSLSFICITWLMAEAGNISAVFILSEVAAVALQ
jgi:hypothetical protein